MKKLKELSISTATHTEISETADNFIRILKKAFDNNRFIMDILSLLQKSQEKLNSAITAVRANPVIARLKELDGIRDDAFLMFRRMLSVYKYSRVEAKKEACLRIWAVLEKAGKSLNMAGYQEQTARTQALFQELDHKDFQTDMKLLEVDGLYESLKVAETDFEEMQEKRVDEDTKMQYPTLKEARIEINTLLVDLMPTLRNVIRTSEPDDDLKWVDLMNENTDQVMIQIASRKTRRENREAEETEGNPSGDQ